jgi:predicted molibdopterin-dependent oxidoreductase YjgC
MFKSEYDRREDGRWDESKQTTTTTICTYCGVGCNLELHEQDNQIVKVTSPLDHPVTRGNLCIKGRFGFQFIQNHEEEEPPDLLEILDGGDGKDGHVSG